MEKEKENLEKKDVNPIGGVNPNSVEFSNHDYEIQQLKKDFAENMHALMYGVLDSEKLNANIKYVIYNLSYKILSHIEYNQYDPYEFILDIRIIAREFGDNDIAEIATKVKNDIVRLDNLLSP